MLYLECAIRKPAGLRDSDVIAVVSDYRGNQEQVQVESGFLVNRAGRHFLPVWGLVQDHAGNLAEVELPQESAGGTNRIWVRPEQLFYQQPAEVTA